MRHIYKTLFVLLSMIACVAAPCMADETPDATLTLKGGSVGAGLGYQWGTGTLTYKGKSYDIKYDGLSLGEVGGSGKNVTGEVFNLKNISDFEGRYAALKTGLTLAGGGEVSAMKNDKGVTINLAGVERGLKLSFGTEGMKFSFADDAAKAKS